MENVDLEEVDAVGEVVSTGFDFAFAADVESWGFDVGGGEAAAVRFCGICGTIAGDEGAGDMRRLPSDWVEGVVSIVGVY